MRVSWRINNIAKEDNSPDNAALAVKYRPYDTGYDGDHNGVDVLEISVKIGGAI